MKTSINIPDDKFVIIKQYCLDEGYSMSRLITKLLMENINERNTVSK